MEKISNFIQNLDMIKGKTIAVVYIFENENAAGYQHYDIWKSDVICSWLMAIQELRCAPLVLDARTFIAKTASYTLPKIDYVINLNNGAQNLSMLALVPSLCAFLNIPCIPCDAATLIVGESKKISNYVASHNNLHVPNSITSNDKQGIVRPDNLGSSIGIKRAFLNEVSSKDLIQEFIPGFDMTIPFLYCPQKEKMTALPPVIYMPNNKEISWFLGENEKRSHDGYKKTVAFLSEEAQSNLEKLVDDFNIHTYCRIDTRVFCESFDDMEKTIASPISLEKIFFLEMNTMPTIKEEINFHTSLANLSTDSDFYEIFNSYNQTIPKHSLTGFILACSIMGLHFKAMH